MVLPCATKLSQIAIKRNIVFTRSHDAVTPYVAFAQNQGGEPPGGCCNTARRLPCQVGLVGIREGQPSLSLTSELKNVHE
jgi:hypothetical protein